MAGGILVALEKGRIGQVLVVDIDNDEYYPPFCV
jgi:hypothetical protein